MDYYDYERCEFVSSKMFSIREINFNFLCLFRSFELKRRRRQRRVSFFDVVRSVWIDVNKRIRCRDSRNNFGDNVNLLPLARHIRMCVWVASFNGLCGLLQCTRYTDYLIPGNTFVFVRTGEHTEYDVISFCFVGFPGNNYTRSNIRTPKVNNTNELGM